MQFHLNLWQTFVKFCKNKDQNLGILLELFVHNSVLSACRFWCERIFENYVKYRAVDCAWLVLLTANVAEGTTS